MNPIVLDPVEYKKRKIQSKFKIAPVAGHPKIAVDSQGRKYWDSEEGNLGHEAGHSYTYWGGIHPLSAFQNSHDTLINLRQAMQITLISERQAVHIQFLFMAAMDGIDITAPSFLRLPDNQIYSFVSEANYTFTYLQKIRIEEANSAYYKNLEKAQALDAKQDGILEKAQQNARAAHQLKINKLANTSIYALIALAISLSISLIGLLLSLGGYSPSAKVEPPSN